MLRNRLIAVLAVIAGLVLVAPADSYAALPQHAPAPTRIKGAVTPLPGCAITLAPKVGSTAGRTCLVPMKTGMAQSRTPSAAQSGLCDFDFYQNGPYGSTAWANGWAACAIGYSNADFYVPTAFNDQASSWDSCASGVFYANQPGTAPAAAFPANSSGDFPWGGVPNDSLSSAYLSANSC